MVRRISGLWLTLTLGWLTTLLHASEMVRIVETPAQGKPMVAHVDAAQTIHLVAQYSQGPMYLRSKDGGHSFDTPISIVDMSKQPDGLEFMVWDMAVSPSGNVHVVLGSNAWKLKLPEDQWSGFHTSLLAGQSKFSNLTNINKKPSEGYSLAVTDDGQVTACWLADRLYANVSRDFGNSFDATIEIDSSYNPCNCCTTSCAYGRDGRLAILYREETDQRRDMYTVLWDQKKNQHSRRRLSQISWNIDKCPMTYYSIRPEGDGYVAAWPTEGKIYFGHLNADGKLLSPIEWTTDGRNGMRTGLLALPVTPQETFVLWNKDDKLGWQRFDDRGELIDQQVSLATRGTGASAVVLADGSIVIFR